MSRRAGWRVSGRWPTKAINFFTPGRYAEYGKRLKVSCEKFGVPLYQQEYEHLETWKQAVCWKPTFISLCLSELMERDGGGVLWIDADAEIVAPLEWGRVAGSDFSACHFRWSPTHQEELLSGVLWFANNHRVKDFLKRWVALTVEWEKKDHDTPEQKALLQAFVRDQKEQSHLHFVEMPIEWLYIDGEEFAKLDIVKGKTPVIRHAQASREMRR